MFEYIFTIGCFDDFNEGDIQLLEDMKKISQKIIIGLQDNSSINKLKNITDIDYYDNRKQNLEKYAHNIFIIDDVDPTKSIKEYIYKNFCQENNEIEKIIIGSSITNSKVINSIYKGDLFFIHDHNDTFKYHREDNNITITRTDKDSGWGQNLIGYKKNWCFISGEDNNSFKYIDYVKSIMPIKSLPYLESIWSQEFKNNKLGLMNYLLQEVVDILNENNIPYYLDCGTLLGCIRENELMTKDSDIDLTIHLSYWEKLNSIDFKKYQLIRTRTIESKNKGYIISVKTKFSNFYCDIYANPAFPMVIEKVLNGKKYNIPKNSELYLKQLYGNWKVPSKNHANWPYLFYGSLIKSEYSQYWDLDYDIGFDTSPKKNNLNKLFWNSYYKNIKDEINHPSSFACFVYEKYIKNDTISKKIIDLGSGNCRDSIYFAKNPNINVIAIDYNGIVSDSTNCKLIKEDCEIALSSNNKLFNKCDIVYMRWFLHAMPYDKAENIFKLASNILDNDALICVEVRSLNDFNLINQSVYDPLDKSYKTTHKRWLYNKEILNKLAILSNCKIIFCEEGHFSLDKNVETTDPLLIRIVYQKC